MAAASLFWIPIGTVIGLYMLYLLFSPKGSKVLSAEYRDIVLLTPDIRYRMPRWFWIMILSFVLILAAFIAFVFFSVRVR